jgi:hypothetical protein
MALKGQCTRQETRASNISLLPSLIAFCGLIPDISAVSLKCPAAHFKEKVTCCNVKLYVSRNPLFGIYCRLFNRRNSINR